MNAPIVKTAILDDDDILSGTSISIIFKDVGEASMDSEETGLSEPIGISAHALVCDDRTQKTGHLFLAHTQFADYFRQFIGSVQNPNALDHDFAYEVFGRPDLSFTLGDIYELAGRDGGVVAYADSIAVQLMETAQEIRVNEVSKANVLIELEETLAMKGLG